MCADPFLLLDEQLNGHTEISFEADILFRPGRYELFAQKFCGATWRMLIIVYDEHISAFAAAFDLKHLDRTWSAYVEFTFTLIHPTDESQNLDSNTEAYNFQLYLTLFTCQARSPVGLNNVIYSWYLMDMWIADLSSASVQIGSGSSQMPQSMYSVSTTAKSPFADSHCCSLECGAS